MEDLQEKERFAVEFYSFTEVVEKLTFQMDRDMVRKAIEIVTDTRQLSIANDTCQVHIRN